MRGKLLAELTTRQWALVLDVLEWEAAGPSEVRETMTAIQVDALDRAREVIRAALEGRKPKGKEVDDAR